MLVLAERLLARLAEFASAAGVMQPGGSDRIALLKAYDAWAHCRDEAGAFMSRNERRRWLHRLVAASGVKVGMTNACCDDLDEHLARTRSRNRNLLDLQGLAELVNDGGLHCLRHDSVSLAAFNNGRS